VSTGEAGARNNELELAHFPFSVAAEVDVDDQEMSAKKAGLSPGRSMFQPASSHNASSHNKILAREPAADWPRCGLE
jgi:hypothetical protein